MNADHTLSSTFAEHEDLAPSADDVLTDLRRHLGTPRRRNTTHALAALAAAAAVAGLAIGITVVSDGGSAPAATSPTLALTSAPSPSATATTPPGPVTKFVLSLDPVWLPGPTPGGQVGVSVSSTSQSRDYLVKDGHADLDLEVRLDRRQALPGRQQGLAPTPAAVNGRPGVEYAKQGFYQESFRTGDGRVAGVYLNPHLPYSQSAEYSAAALTRIGRHIARDLRFDGSTVVRTSAVLTYLPDGVTVAEIRAGDNGAGFTNYTLVGPNGVPDASVNIGGTEGGIAGGHGKAGRPVQGHRSEVIRSGNYYQLRVINLRPGHSVSLSTGDSVPTLGDLYRIADGIRFTS